MICRMPLGELALDLRWTWSHEADALWERVDAEVWRRTQNPWTILQDISAERLRALPADSLFIAELERLTRARPGRVAHNASQKERPERRM